ncbi:MAG: hypothetical protein FJX94_06070 [Bacteroidetes bacterium]|nr:hypothetical protein [Bacteroidota bacterium]
MYRLVQMETNTPDLISIRRKLQQLAKVHESLRKENEQLKIKLSAAESKLRDAGQQLEVAEMQNALLKSAQQQLSESEKKALEKKLSFFIREIDKCIAALTR